MTFRNGDPVMHWTFGFGKVIDLEKRLDSQKEVLHYVVQIDDMKIWVPADEMLSQRLRSPSSEKEFKHLQTILDNKKETLPKDRLLRKNMISEMLKDGSAEALFRVARGLANYRKSNPLNEIMTKPYCAAWKKHSSVSGALRYPSHQCKPKQTCIVCY